MRLIISNILRGVKKRALQYLSIIFLLIIIVSSITGLYQSGYRVQQAFDQVANNSVAYNYRIKTKDLNNFKNSDEALSVIKNIIKKDFYNSTDIDQKELATINNQIDINLTVNQIKNNTLPSEVNLNRRLKKYLLNWGVNYKLILINSIIHERSALISKDSIADYKFKSSFVKTFGHNNYKNKKLFFNFEDAFNNEKIIPFTPTVNHETKIFDIAPFRDGFNKIYITKGLQPKETDEIVINPEFAKKNNIVLNQEVELIPGYIQKVVGFGYSYWGVFGETTYENNQPSPENTTQVFASYQWINEYLIENNTLISKLQTILFLKVLNDDIFFADRVEKLISNYFNFSYGSIISKNENDIRGGALKNNYKMQNIVFSSISIVILVIAVFIVLFYVRKEIELQKKQIGLMKALGYKNNEISFGFTLLFFFITIFSVILGYATGILLQLKFNTLTGLNLYLPLATIGFSWVALLVCVIFVPLIFAIFSYCQSMSSLGVGTLTLVYDKPKNGSSNWISILKRPFFYWSFRSRVTIAFALKSVGKLLLVFFTFIFATFLLLFQIIATDVFNNKINNLFNYVNGDVYSLVSTTSMYTNFNSDGRVIDNPIFNWKPLPTDINKQITKERLKVNAENIKYFLELSKKDLRGYFINKKDVNDVGKIMATPKEEAIKKFYDGDDESNKIIANKLYDYLNKFYETVTSQVGLARDSDKLPGISLGANIIGQGEFPNLEFPLNLPPSWNNASQGRSLAKKITVTTLYNRTADSTNTARVWRDWFNLKELKNLDTDSVFNIAHDLKSQEATYTDNFGQANYSKKVYIVPAAISKSLATLNNYKIGRKILMLINTNNGFIPVIFEVHGIIATDLDSSKVFTNIDDIRKAVGYYDNNGAALEDSFNAVYSKEQSIFLNNFVGLSTSNGKYFFNDLKNNVMVINNTPTVFPIIKEVFKKLFINIRNVLLITQWLTIIGLVFVLIIIINMILDNNILIIAMMKSLGYKINEINTLIISSYIVTLLIAFVIGTIFGYLAWNVIILITAVFSGTVFLVPIKFLTILFGFVLISMVLIIGYFVGLYFIKFKPVTSLLQTE